MTEESYNEYINDFNSACSGDGSGFAEFYDKYYEPCLSGVRINKN